MILQDVLDQVVEGLKGISESPRLDADLIISSVLSCRREDLYIKNQEQISSESLAQIFERTKRRALGEPMAYILGEKSFWKSSFDVESGVLIPRPETEGIVEKTLEWIKSQEDLQGLGREVRGLDVGTGSGCIAISLLQEVPNLKMWAVDISPVSKRVSLKNAKKLGVDPRFLFQEADASRLTEILDKNLRFDFVVSNPPYISKSDPDVQESVRRFEPHEALFAEQDGLEKIESWSRQAGHFLRPGGFWIFEMGHQQSEEAQKCVQSLGLFNRITSYQDDSGRDRFVTAIKT